MNFYLSIRRQAVNNKKDKRFVVCFKHAVEYSQKPGWEIIEEVDEFNSEYDTRSVSCKICHPKY